MRYVNDMNVGGDPYDDSLHDAYVTVTEPKIGHDGNDPARVSIRTYLTHTAHLLLQFIVDALTQRQDMPEIHLRCLYLLPLSSRYVNGTVLYQRSSNLCYTNAVKAVEEEAIDDSTV